MSVITDMTIEIDPAELLRREGDPDNEEIRNVAQWAAGHCRQLAQPALSFQRHRSIQPVSRGLLVGETHIEIGPHRGLVQGAQEVIAAMATLGKILDDEIAALQVNAQTLEAYMLGCAGFLALDQVALHLRNLVEEMAAQKGWGVSPALSPGALNGWCMDDQPALCFLADAPAVGVEVGETFLLRPKYSLSLLIGLGPDFSEHKVAATCQYCAINKSCQYRSKNNLLGSA